MKFNVDVTVETDLPSGADIDAANAFGIFAMSQQALMDSNFYCKEDQGTLIDSSLIYDSIPYSEIESSDLDTLINSYRNTISSHPNECELAWVTPYAKKQYYLESASKDTNENAQMMWFHKAKDVHYDEWQTAYTKGFMKGLKK